MRSRRDFGVELASLGLAMFGCSAGTRLREPEDAGDAAPPACPTGATGTKEGLVLPQGDLTGYRNGAGPFASISTCDYFDPDGSRGLRALLVIRSGAWCVPCQSLAKQLGPIVDGYLARGARILEVLVNGNSAKQPATQATLDAWIAKYGCTYDVARANADVLGRPDDGVPTCFFVSPRTLVIESVNVGSDIIDGKGVIAGLETILHANGA
jgi:hypothetical protein